jgi:hypothetical protein
MMSGETLGAGAGVLADSTCEVLHAFFLFFALSILCCDPRMPLTWLPPLDGAELLAAARAMAQSDGLHIP